MTTAKKTPGLIGLERIVDSAHTYALGKTRKISSDALGEMSEQVRADADGRAPEGMKLLVRIALAARQDHRGGCAPETCGGMSLDPCPLANALKAFERWEKSL